MKRDPLSLGATDYLLSLISAISVLLSAGYSVRNIEAGFVFTGLTILGHLVSAFGPRIERTWHRVSPDTIIFAMVAAGSIAFAGHLNQFLPNMGFPLQLMYTAGLCWAIAFGSFFAWRDSTLLFLGVPSIALYGLVGAFDTFPGAPFMFFLFLVTTGMIFARSHLRHMLRLASSAGEPNLERLRRYEWKSLAGPEWAMVSAVGIVVFSALGAPFIRNTVQGVSAPLRIPIRATPPTAASSSGIGSGTPNPNRDSLRVGSGPYGRPSHKIVVYARMDSPHYLRGEAFYRFVGNRWWAVTMNSAPIPASDGVSDLRGRNPETLLPNLRPFPYELSSATNHLPGPYFPGIPAQIQFGNSRRVNLREDGIMTTGLDSLGALIRGISFEPDLSSPGRAIKPPYWRDSFDEVSISFRAKELVQRTLRGASTDYERAERLRSLVAKTITYNLQAAMVPDGANVVDSALFESRQGYCDVFATTLAMLARHAGLPSRVASGYLVSDESRGRGFYRIRESDYHIWTEIYFEKAGWVTFDATDGANEVEGYGRGDEWSPPPTWWQSSWNSTAANIIIGASVICMAGVFLWDVVRRRAPRLGKVLIVRDERQAAAASALDALERATRTPRRFEETSSEYASRLHRMFPQAQIDQEGLARAIDRLLFAPAGTLDSAATKTLAKATASLRKVKN